MKDSTEYAKSKGKRAERMLVVISSPNLVEDIGMTIQQINENTVHTIKNSFIEVDVSNRLKERGSLYGAPFKVDITILPLKGTIFERAKHVGRGQKVNLEVRHNIDLDALYDFGYVDDNYCLFRSIELLRRREEMTRQRFSEYRHDIQRQTRDILQLLEELNIPIKLDGYDAETYAPILQNYYDRMFPGKFRIIFFSDVGQYKPFFKTQTFCFDVPLCIYYANGHFTAIRTVSTFFSIRNYCFYCEKPYDRDATHAIRCTGRCMLCCVVGSGMCIKSGGYERRCDGCYKTFKNAMCYVAHLNSACNVSKQCEKCGVIYNINQVKGKHVCYTKYCK